MFYFTCYAQKLINSYCFRLISILDKIQNGGQDGDHVFFFGDVTDLQQRHYS